MIRVIFMDLRIKVCRVCRVPNSRCTIGDGFNMDIRWQVEYHIKCVQLRQSSTKRMPNLKPGLATFLRRPHKILTRVTEVAPFEAISLFTSAKIVVAVCSC